MPWLIDDYPINNLLTDDKIEEIVLSERTEALIPLAYMTLTLMAYYGPNTENLGNIKLNIWHMQTKIEHIENFVFNLCLLFLIDMLSFIINSILIWKFCKMNVLKIMHKVQQTCWFFMGNSEALLLMLVSQIHYKLFHISIVNFSSGFWKAMHWWWKWPNFGIWLDRWKILNGRKLFKFHYPLQWNLPLVSSLWYLHILTLLPCFYLKHLWKSFLI